MIDEPFNAKEYLQMLTECIETDENKLVSFIKTETEKIIGKDINEIFVSDIENSSKKAFLILLQDSLASEHAKQVETLLRKNHQLPELPVPELPRPDKIFQPSPYYPPLYTFNFNSIRCPHTKFDNGFVRGSNSSILLFISMHGSTILDKDDKIDVNECFYLNKFSAAGAGQCSYVSNVSSRYIAYAVCDAINSNGTLDVSTILREASAHHFALGVPESAIKNYENTIQPSLLQHVKSNASQYCIKSNIVLGDRMTIGKEFIEKRYSIEPGDKDGIIICKDWPEIGAKQLDNLLENPVFIEYMIEDSVVDLRSSVKSLTKDTNEEIPCVKATYLSDLISFCELHGRPYVSILDNACSNMRGHRSYNSDDYKKFGHDLDMLDPNIAKGFGKKGTNKSKSKSKKKNKDKKDKTNKKDKRKKTRIKDKN